MTKNAKKRKTKMSSNLGKVKDMFVKKKFFFEQPFNRYQHQGYNQGLENLNDNFQFFILALDYRQICSHLFI